MQRINPASLPAVFVKFSCDLVSYGLLQILDEHWESPYLEFNDMPFDEVVGLAAVVFRQRHEDEFCNDIDEHPEYILQDVDTVLKYLRQFITKNFKAVYLVLLVTSLFHVVDVAHSTELLTLNTLCLAVSVCCVVSSLVLLVGLSVERTIVFFSCPGWRPSPWQRDSNWQPLYTSSRMQLKIRGCGFYSQQIFSFVSSACTACCVLFPSTSSM